MEVNEDYRNMDSFHPKTTREGKRSPDELKPDDGDQATMSALGRWSLPILYTILSLSILLSILTLVTASILIRQISSEVQKSETVLLMGFAQWKNNVTGNYEELSSALTGLQAEISRLGQNTPRCPHGWCLSSQHCYYFSSTKRNWTDAQLFCESNDAHLVVINNAEGQDFVSSHLSDSYWIGLKCTYGGGTSHWSWLDGTNYSSSKSCSSSGVPCDPCNGDICMKHCAAMTSDGCWNATLCNVSMNWVCEKSAQWCHS